MLRESRPGACVSIIDEIIYLIKAINKNWLANLIMIMDLLVNKVALTTGVVSMGVMPIIMRPIN